MKLIFDDNFNQEIKQYLLGQPGINDVNIIDNEITTEININYENTTPLIILKYIEIFQNNKYNTLFSFDKENISEVKELKYLIDDICCEYCYKSLMRKLFENEFIKSAKSNFDFNKPAYNIELVIEYKNDYNENKLIEYIKENTK